MVIVPLMLVTLCEGWLRAIWHTKFMVGLRGYPLDPSLSFEWSQVSQAIYVRSILCHIICIYIL